MIGEENSPEMSAIANYKFGFATLRWGDARGIPRAILNAVPGGIGRDVDAECAESRSE